MNILSILLRRLFPKSGPLPAPPQKMEGAPPLNAFEVWIRGYRQRLNQDCERDEPSK